MVANRWPENSKFEIKHGSVNHLPKIPVNHNTWLTAFSAWLTQGPSTIKHPSTITIPESAYSTGCHIAQVAFGACRSHGRSSRHSVLVVSLTPLGICSVHYIAGKSWTTLHCTGYWHISHIHLIWFDLIWFHFGSLLIWFDLVLVPK